MKRQMQERRPSPHRVDWEDHRLAVIQIKRRVSCDARFNFEYPLKARTQFRFDFELEDEEAEATEFGVLSVVVKF